MMFVINLFLFCFSLSLLAGNLVVPRAMESFCKKAYIPIENGNYANVEPIVVQDNRITAISYNELSNGSYSLLIIDNKSGNELFNIGFADFKITDMESDKNTLWVVANKGFSKSKLYHIRFNEYRDFEISEFPTHNLGIEQGKFDRAYGLSVDENFVYIAHGGLGVVAFSKAYEKPVLHNNPDLNPNSNHRSYATDVLVVNKDVLVGLDTITYSFSNKTRAFQGYAILDKTSFNLKSSVRINQKRESLFEPKLFLNGDQVVMSTLHLFFINDLSNIYSSKVFVPQKRIYKYAKGLPLGLSFVSNNQILACFKDDRNFPVTSFADIVSI